MTTEKHSWEIFSPLAYLSILASCYDSVTCYHVPASSVPRLMLPPIRISVWPRHGICLLLSDANLSELLTCDIYCSKHFFFRGYFSASSLVTSHCGLLEPNSWILVFNQRCFVLTPLLRCIVHMLVSYGCIYHGPMSSPVSGESRGSDHDVLTISELRLDTWVQPTLTTFIHNRWYKKQKKS